MLAVAGIVITALLIAIVEVPSLLKAQRKRELWLFAILLAIGTGLGIAQGLHLPIANPVDGITAVYRPIDDALKFLWK